VCSRDSARVTGNPEIIPGCRPSARNRRIRCETKTFRMPFLFGEFGHRELGQFGRHSVGSAPSENRFRVSRRCETGVACRSFSKPKENCGLPRLGRTRVSPNSSRWLSIRVLRFWTVSLGGRCGQSAIPLNEGLQADASTHDAGQRALRAAFLGFFLDMFDMYLPVVALGPAMSYFQPATLSPALKSTMFYIVFALSLVGRPVGATLFGHYGDRIGRRRVTIIPWLASRRRPCSLDCCPDTKAGASGAS
jgi:hypothetical protein